VLALVAMGKTNGKTAGGLAIRALAAAGV